MGRRRGAEGKSRVCKVGLVGRGRLANNDPSRSPKVINQIKRVVRIEEVVNAMVFLEALRAS